jgi:hypothetical protein
MFSSQYEIRRHACDPSPVTFRLMKTPERDTLPRGEGYFSPPEGFSFTLSGASTGLGAGLRATSNLRFEI